MYSSTIEQFGCKSFVGRREATPAAERGKSKGDEKKKMRPALDAAAAAGWKSGRKQCRATAAAPFQHLHLIRI